MTTVLISRAASLAAGLALAGLVSGSACAATAISGSVDAAVRASMGYGPYVVTNDQHTDSWTSTPQNVSATAHTLATYGVDSVDVTSSNTAVWESADKGSLTFADSWDMVFGQLETQNETAQFGFHPSGLGDWTYTFTADSDGFITFDYSVYSQGDLAGIGGWGLRWRKVGENPSPLQFLTPNNTSDDYGQLTLTGSLAVALQQGGTYTFRLEKESNIGIGGGVGSRAALTSGNIDWAISSTSAVPEPSAWALMILGMGLMGFSLRRANLVGRIV